MKKVHTTVQKMLELTGLNECAVNCDVEGKKLTIFVNEGEWFKKMLPQLILDVEHLTRLIARKNALDSVFIDINNYRKERESLIVELAKASARKALLKKEEITLPPMNAYERRLIHLELSTRPDVKTESMGEGKERHVIVKPLQ